MKKNSIKKILQIGLVVDDLYAYMKRYNDDYGIGPWMVYDFNGKTVENMTVHGKRIDYIMKMALTRYFDVEIELIEPKDNNSIYSEFLKKHGSGVHHIAFDTDDPDEFIEDMKERGNEISMHGYSRGVHFAYIDMLKDLGVVGELYKMDPGLEMPVIPDGVYPGGND